MRHRTSAIGAFAVIRKTMLANQPILFSPGRPTRVTSSVHGSPGFRCLMNK